MDNREIEELNAARQDEIQRAQQALDRVKGMEASNEVVQRPASAVAVPSAATMPPPPVRRNLSRKTVIARKEARRRDAWAYAASAALVAIGLTMGFTFPLLIGLVLPIFTFLMAPVNTYHKAVELWSREQAPKAIQGQRTEMNFKALAIRFIPETMTEREAGRIKKAVLDANPDATKTLILRRKAEIALPSLAYLQDDQPVNTSVLISEGSGDIVEWSELDEVEVWEEAIENALAL